MKGRTLKVLMVMILTAALVVSFSSEFRFAAYAGTDDPALTEMSEEDSSDAPDEEGADSAESSSEEDGSEAAGSVSADENGSGDVDEASDEASDTEEANESSGDFHFKEGTHKFLGWNTKADGSGQSYNKGDDITIPAGEEIVLYAQRGGLNITHYHDYVMSFNAGGLGITGDWMENMQQYEEPSFTLKDLILAMGEETGFTRKITVDDPDTLAVGSLTGYMDYKYKLTKVTVNDEEVTDLSKTYGQLGDTTIKFYYELEQPIELTVYGKDFKGSFTGEDQKISGFTTETASHVAHGTLVPVAETGDGKPNYKFHPGANKNEDWSPDMSVRYAGEGMVVPTSWTVNEDGSATPPEGWTKNDDGSYTVPESDYRLIYGYSAVTNWTSLPMPLVLKYVPGKYEITESEITYRSEDPSMGSVSLATEKVGRRDADPAGSTAAAAGGYHFAYWTDADGNRVSASANYVPEKKPGTYIAHFEKDNAPEKPANTDEPKTDTPKKDNTPAARPARNNPAAAPAVPVAPQPEAAPEAGPVEPEINVPEPEVPKAEAPEEESWPLINVIACVATVLGAVLALMRRKEDDDEERDDDDDDDARKARIAKIAGVAIAAASVIALFVTEDFVGTMVMVDKWTILMVALLGGQAVSAGLNHKYTEEYEEEE